MLKISFTNAEVSDHGYGLEVNGKSLEDIISTALGTKVKGNGGYGSGLPSFSSNSSLRVVPLKELSFTTAIQL